MAEAKPTTDPVHWKESTSWDQLLTDLPNGITTSKFRVGTPDDPDAPTVFRTFFPPNTTVPPHTHECDYAEVILEGSQQVTRKWYYPGDIRIAKAGTVYGPLIAGPEGALVLLIFRDGSFSPVSPTGDGGQFSDYQKSIEEWSE